MSRFFKLSSKPFYNEDALLTYIRAFAITSFRYSRTWYDFQIQELCICSLGIGSQALLSADFATLRSYSNIHDAMFSSERGKTAEISISMQSTPTWKLCLKSKVLVSNKMTSFDGTLISRGGKFSKTVLQEVFCQSINLFPSPTILPQTPPLLFTRSLINLSQPHRLQQYPFFTTRPFLFLALFERRNNIALQPLQQYVVLRPRKIY